jgi:hypothetical protein
MARGRRPTGAFGLPEGADLTIEGTAFMEVRRSA